MKHKKGTSKAVALLAGAIICFFFVHRSKELAPGLVDRISSTLVLPFLFVQRSLVEPTARFVHEWRRKATVDDEYQAAVKERDDLQAQVLELQATQRFADETEEVRAFKDQYALKGAVLARVLLRQLGDIGNFFIIEGGTDKGIHKDTAVVYKNCLVGKVVEVYPFYSKIVLISDPGCKVAAYCDGTGTQGIYEGTGSGVTGLLTHVGHLSELREGDTVFSSGEGIIFPKGFGIGKITTFSKNEGDMQYTVVVSLFLDFSAISYCYVLEKERVA